MALDYKQKTFVAHPNVQEVCQENKKKKQKKKEKKGKTENRDITFHNLTDILSPFVKIELNVRNDVDILQLIENKWVDDWYEWKMRKTWQQCLTVLLRIILLPLIALIILIIPNTRIAKFFSSPVNKCLHSVASYLVFLIVVFLISNADKNKQLRGPPDTGIEFVLLFFFFLKTNYFDSQTKRKTIRINSKNPIK